MAKLIEHHDLFSEFAINFRYFKIAETEFFTNLRPKLPSHNVTFKSTVTIGKGGEQKNLL